MTMLASEQMNGNGDRRIAVEDSSQFANLLDSNKFGQLWRVATLFADSQMVPAHFQKKPADCFIAAQMAMRMGVDPFMFMQNTYIVHGRPGLEAKLAIALINSSGLFTDSLDYEIEGTNPKDAKYRVRAFATRKSTNRVVYGTWVDWDTVRAEQWDSKPGSKWKTIPGLMFQYRAATFFGRLHCPERLMGMRTADELFDTSGGDEPGVRQVVSREVSPETPKSDLGAIAQQMKAKGQAKATVVEQQQNPQPPASASDKVAPSTAAPVSNQQQAPEPDTGGVEAEPPDKQEPEEEDPAAAAAKLDHSKYVHLVKDKARDNGHVLSRADVEGSLFKFATRHQIGDAKLLTPQLKATLYSAVCTNVFDFKTGTILHPAT